MRRRLLNLLTALSLLLCLAAVALWARSHFVGVHFEHNSFSHDGLGGIPGDHHLSGITWYVGANSGELYVTRLAHRMGGNRRDPKHFFRHGEGWRWEQRPPNEAPPDEDGPLSWIGVLVVNDDNGTENTYRYAVVPLWLTAAAFATLPAATTVTRLRRRRPRHRPGLCPA